MHEPNFLEGRFLRAADPVLPVKIFSSACGHGSIGRGPECSAQKVQTEDHRVESDSCGSFSRKPSSAGVVDSAWLGSSVIRLLALAFGMGIQGHGGVGEKAEIGEMRESRPWASTRGVIVMPG